MQQKIRLTRNNEALAIGAAVRVLKAGGLVVYPTETVYGLGCDATNNNAVRKLLCYKTRREGKPLSVAVSDITMAQKYVVINQAAKSLYKNFLPGPVTVVSKGRHKVSQGIESELGALGIRIPDYPLVRKIVRAFGKPITATSANASYKKRPYTIRDITDNISTSQLKLLDLILDAGTLPTREPSTVIDTTRNELVTLRQGDIIVENKRTITTNSEKETIALGQKIMEQHRHYLGFKSVIFCLEGELGSGKTQFTKGVALALNIKERITSPTFILEQEYPFKSGRQKMKLFHIDTWRMESNGEFRDLGFRSMTDRSNVIAIEWAERVLEAVKSVQDKAKTIWVKLAYGTTENQRVISWGNLPAENEDLLPNKSHTHQ